MTTTCSTCGGEVQDGMLFCGHCGTRLPLRCAACGRAAELTDQRFCAYCGTALGQPLAPPRERRLVSVLFCDLTGFTTFSETRDAEDVRDVLEHYFAAVRRVVATYGGTIEKYIGDAVMALWGAPVAREDDPERAARAGLDIAAAVVGLSQRLALDELRVRIGILTGEAAVDVGGAETGMVIGDAVNTASRIQAMAAPGTVLVDDVTRLASEQSIAYEPVGTHEVRGRSTSVRLWRAMRVISLRGGGGRPGAVEPPLVGRESELAAIKGAVGDLLAPDAGTALLAVIAGAGLGKSRLVWELEKYTDGIDARLHWLQGRSLGFGEEAGFGALAEIVRMAAGVALDEPREQQSAAVTAWIDELFGASHGDTARVLRAARRLLALDDGSELIQPGALFSAWRALLERIALRDPLVLIFEELQRADQGLLDFLVHLLEWGQAPMLVLALGRPDTRLEQVAERGLWIGLEPLSGEQIDELVLGVLADAPEALLRAVRADGGGVPLFAVETLRALADAGALAVDGGRYVIRRELGELAIPPTIRALVASRLDRLGQIERQVLTAGAVLGERFAAAGAAALSGVDETDARTLLDGLVAKQLLELESDPRSPLRGRYGFLQGAMRRVLIGMLSRQVRKRHHLAAVAFLSSDGPGPELAAALAGHLLEAADADPSAEDAGEIRLRAVVMLREAAERAFAVGAPEQAVALLDRTAGLEETDSERAAILHRAGEIAHRSGTGEVAAERFRLAGEAYQAAGMERERLGVRAHELRAMRYVRAPAGLVPELTELADALSDDSDGWSVFVMGVLAFTLYQCGRHQEAVAVAQRAIEAGEACGATAADLLGPLGAQGSSMAELGRTEESIATFRRALAIAETEDPRRMASLQGNIAVSLGAIGRYAESAEAAREAIVSAERSSERLQQRWARLGLGRALCSLGEWDSAVDQIEAVIGQVPPFQIGMATAPLVVIALARDESERVTDLIAEHDRRCAEDDASVFESDIRALRQAVLALAAGDQRELAGVIPGAEVADFAEWSGWVAPVVDMLAARPEREPLERALLALRGPGRMKRTDPVLAQVERLAAHVAARSGDDSGAAAAWGRAAELAQRCGAQFEVAAIALERAEHDGGDLGAAIATFERLRAEPWLTRARRAAIGLVRD